MMWDLVFLRLEDVVKLLSLALGGPSKRAGWMLSYRIIVATLLSFYSYHQRAKFLKYWQPS